MVVLSICAEPSLAPGGFAAGEKQPLDALPVTDVIERC